MDEKFLLAWLESHSTCLANMSVKLDFLNVLLQLSGLERKEVGILVESFPQDCRNYIIRVQKVIFRRDLFYRRIVFPKLFLDPECILFAFLKIFFSAGLLNMNAICPEEYLAKKTFGKKSIRLCHNLWTISKNNLAYWREKQIILALLTINFGFRGKILLVRQSWVPPAQGFAMSGTIFLEQWNFLDGLCTCGAKFGRYVKIAFNVSHQTIWEFFLRENIKFSHHVGILAKNFRTC